MLWSLNSNTEITSIPHKTDYARWRSRLSDLEYQQIIDHLSAKIEGSEIQTSSWIPGSNWDDTVYAPIFFKACEQDFEAAAKFFGLLLWEVMLRDKSYWSFGRYEKDGIPIQGLTYFKVEPPK